MRALLLVLTLLSCGSAAEVSSESKAKIRQLYTQMLDHDWWSATELEAWALPQGIKLGPALGSDTLVLGNPAFATPEDVIGVRDFGGQVQVMTYQRWHCFATDGHPLAASVPFHLQPARCGFSYSGRSASVVQYDPELSTTWRLHTFSVPEGVSQLDTTGAEKSGRLVDRVVISDDGTAAAMNFYDDTLDKSWIILSIAQMPRILIDNLAGIIGVGGNGTWLLATHHEGSAYIPTLIIDGKKGTMLQAGAAGPGIAAVISSDGRFQLVAKDGSLHPFQLPINLGSHPQLATIGEWLVVSSGDGAKSLDDTNILGATMPDPPEQPDTLACIRWADLKSIPTSAPVECYCSPLSVDTNQSAALFLWREHEVQRLDLSTTHPHLVPMGSYEQKVTWVGSADFWSVVSQGQDASIVNDQGEVLFTGPGRIKVGTRDSALVSTGSEDSPETTYVHLAVDPKQRVVIPLVAENGNRITNQPFNDWLLVDSSDHEHWHLLDRKGVKTPYGGSYLRKDSPRPQFTWSGVSGGRFFSVHGRTFFKAGSEPALDDWLWPMDAFYDQNFLLVLTVQQHLLKYGQGHKELEWSDLGYVERGNVFCLHQGQPAVMDWDHSLRGTLSDTGTLLTDEVGRGENLPPGPWQVNRLDFIPPNGTECHWIDDPIGFTPHLLRSNPADSGMLVVTSSLIIILGHDEAGLMSRRR